MAERRMFNKSLFHSNAFIQLSRQAFQLYIYLCLSADDDGFTNGWKTLFRICRCSQKHMQELIDGGWILPFENDLVVVTHWLAHNQIKKDRYKPTIYQDQMATLEKSKTGAYIRLDPKRIQNGSKLDPQERIGEDSLGKDRSGQDRQDQERIEKDIFLQSSGRADAACDDPEIDFEKILYDYQVLCKELVPCKELTPGLREKIREVFRMGYNQYTFINLFSRASMSAFLCGQNPQGWRASMDWLLEPAHLREVLDGKYDNWRRPAGI